MRDQVRVLSVMVALIKLVADPAKNFVLIMKDGKIYKNTLSH